MSPDSIAQDIPTLGRESKRALPALGILARLSLTEREDLAEQCLWHWYEPGAEILRHSDATREVHFIIRGAVRVAVYSACGREVIFDDQAPGTMFGELAAIDGRPRAATVCARERTLIASLPPERFAALIHRSPAFCEAVLRHLATVVRRLNSRVVAQTTLRVSDRIRRELLRLARDGDAPRTVAFLPPITHAELASRIGTHREAVTREINRLVAMNVVARQGRGLVIKDRAALAQMIRDGHD
jgi:CRP/FNR family transcriptional regulator, cyclic AMP receptor protein